MEQSGRPFAEIADEFQADVATERVSGERNGAGLPERGEVGVEVLSEPGVVERPAPTLSATAASDVYAMHSEPSGEGVPCHRTHVPTVAGPLQAVNEDESTPALAPRTLLDDANCRVRRGRKPVLDSRNRVQLLEPGPEVRRDGGQVGIGDQGNKGPQTDSVADAARIPDYSAEVRLLNSSVKMMASARSFIGRRRRRLSLRSWR